MLQPQNSISRVLLTSVLTVYFLLTLTITMVQVAIEYNNTRDSLLNDIRQQHHTFAASFARAMWEFNIPQAEALATGLLNVPSISGIILRDEQGRQIYQAGRVPPKERLEQLNSPDQVIEYQGVFGFYSPLVWEFAGGSEIVGEVILFSSRDITIEKLKPTLAVLVVAALIKSALLIILFTIAFRIFLRRPFSQFIEQIRQFNPDDPDGSQVFLQQAESNEFTLLEHAYNELLQRLRHHQEAFEISQRELADANRQLEEQNIKLEREISEKTIGISNLMLDIERRRQELEVRQQSLEQEIHQRRLTESKLKQANRELEETIEFLQQARSQVMESEKLASLGALVASISHDVSTPLGVSLTATSYLKEQLDQLQTNVEEGKLTREQFAKFINNAVESEAIVAANLERANEIMDGFKQMAVDQITDSERDVYIDEYVNKIIKALQPKLRKKNVSVAIECPHIVAKFSVGAFAQALTNMLMNSIIHGFKDRNQGVISLKLEQQDNRLVGEYHDNGIGLTSNQLEHLFEPFFTTERSQGGSGLGTHIIYDMITHTLNGHIDVSSTPNQGLLYTFQFPVKFNAKDDENNS
ncbi:ATP-binding protein [Aliidiomarina haloalkalitolerans]|uniref:histidine kinase n=2 Tax=Aliidiomarina haloalkalitolerans TaxID=859059 RepID=A0A432VU52_9GAMM|nr:ATP-binding protein [Aliidiomarina haloalkalitolerans]